MRSINFGLILVSIFLGFIITQQFYLHQRVSQVSKPEETNTLGLEVANLIETNNKLAKEAANLKDEKDKLNRGLLDRQTANQTVAENTLKYKMIAGAIDVYGPGVTLYFSSRLEQTQLIDLLNALRNIGAEAISINGERITPNFGFSATTFSSPYTILVIGEPGLLENALTRRGGILDLITVQAQVQKQDKMLIGAAKS